jgi:hypothetical protein
MLKGERMNNGLLFYYVVWSVVFQYVYLVCILLGSDVMSAIQAVLKNSVAMLMVIILIVVVSVCLKRHITSMSGELSI